MSTAALFTRAKKWKQLRYQWTDEWMGKKVVARIYNGAKLSCKKKE